MKKNRMEKGSPGLWKGSKSITLINRYLFFVGITLAKNKGEY